MKLSVIIPVLNEEKSIVEILDYLLQNVNNDCVKEIIVVDGGSTDNSLNLLKAYSSVIVLNSKKGRAVQMNYGASKASGDILYFLVFPFKTVLSKL